MNAIHHEKTIISLIKSCIQKSHLVQLHSLLLRSSHFYNPTVFLSFLSRLALPPFRDLSYSGRIFYDFPEPNVSLYNTMIRAHSLSCDSARVGFLLYQELLRLGISANALSATVAVKCCTKIESLCNGIQIHARIWKDGHLSDGLLMTTLMCFYSCLEKGGEASKVFDEMSHRDVVAWNVLISCYTHNGRSRDALSLFDMMSDSNVCPPDDVTCLLVLRACASLNALEWGEIVHIYILENGFISLKNVWNELINSMKIEPDAAIWRTLLGACRIHHHVDLGEQVVDHLVELKAQEAGDYILLLNIYSSAGKLDKVLQVRKMMKDKKILTTPASSTIELKGRVHEFYADDVSHPRKKEIYEMLDEINQQLKIGGYVVEITSELQVKESKPYYVLSYHSEKLAIAFGVLTTPPGTAIRVAKDLRICMDCHNFCKVLSAVYDRKVVVRDRSRFHHFRGGRCSCNDYW